MNEAVVLASVAPVATGRRSRLAVTLTQWEDTPPRVELRYEVCSLHGRWYTNGRRLGLPVFALADLRRALEDVGNELNARRVEAWRERYATTEEA